MKDTNTSHLAGEFLLEEIETRSLTQKELAR
jgi:plasmid maintenance system antidote protein VapI